MTEDEQIECMARAIFHVQDGNLSWEEVPEYVHWACEERATAAHRALMEKVRAEAGELVERLQQYGDGLPGGLLLMRQAADALALLAQPFPREHIEALLDSHARLFKFVVKHNELFDDIEDDWTDAIEGAAADEPIRAMLKGET